MQGRMIVCDSCGRELGHIMGQMPCEEMEGWITISQWKGKESVDHLNFCSSVCLQQWFQEQFPRVPEVFLRSFDSEDET